MKPIFIILIPEQIQPLSPQHRDNMRKEILNSIGNEYHVLIVNSEKKDWDFKLLNGTKENYDSIAELKEQFSASFL